MANIFTKLFRRGKPAEEEETPVEEEDLSVDRFANAVASAMGVRSWGGDKFQGGFGDTWILRDDYWTLRARSAQLFETNLYARGLIRRLITNEINTGLHLEAAPIEEVLGYPEEGLVDFSEKVETRFELWGKNKDLVDATGQETFGGLQALALREAYIEGDVLVVLHHDPLTGLPKVRIIKGGSVRTPFGRYEHQGNRIVHGVEIDSEDRQVAYWVRSSKPSLDGTYEYQRIPAFSETTGRRFAWLVYGVDKRLDDVRGKPLLSIVLQSLREVDRYRDAAQRKALINAMLAMFIEKTEDKPGTAPITSGGAVRREVMQTASSSDAQGPREFTVAEQIPGVIIQELQKGERPVSFGANGTDEKFSAFEEAIICAVAWANEVPPEILRLSFNSNYSASQAAINEYKAYLNRRRTKFGSEFCAPIYEDWFYCEADRRNISAPRFVEYWHDPTKWLERSAWINSEWAGQIKPAVDMSKLVTGYMKLLEAGLITRDRACRELTGMKYSTVVRQLKVENEQLAEAVAPLIEAGFFKGAGRPAAKASSRRANPTSLASAYAQRSTSNGRPHRAFAEHTEPLEIDIEVEEPR